ncbi:MAG: RNA methyltransferase [Patescibacteria group bacterium]|jgi:TrmH family RNA methyltransferase
MISSSHNDRILNIVKLTKPRERSQQGLFIIEGERELELALKNKYQIQELFYSPEISPNNKFSKHNLITTEVSANIFKKIAYKEKPDGYLALAKIIKKDLKGIKLSANPLIIVLEMVEKPGNLGAILRTAYAAKVDAVIITDPQTDIYNPNVVRASMGHLFTNQVVVATTPETKEWLKKNKIKSYGTTIKAKKYYHQVSFKSPSAIIMGTESIGLSAEWLKNINNEIKIPMQSGIDSLNVSVSSAIVIYEAKRQRGFV